jgi:hypothetical protein
MTVTFLFAGVFGGIYEYLANAVQEKTTRANVGHDRTSRTVQTQCLPLYSILAAIGVGHVDYFSLDIEGAEIGVLETFPFDDVTVETLSIENRVYGNKTGTADKTDLLVDLMQERGFRIKKTVGSDVIFSRV